MANQCVAKEFYKIHETYEFHHQDLTIILVVSFVAAGLFTLALNILVSIRRAFLRAFRNCVRELFEESDEEETIWSKPKTPRSGGVHSCPPKITKRIGILSASPDNDKDQADDGTEDDTEVEQENLSEYGDGGYMPVVLGQHVGPRNQFKVIRKLGFGHFSTVWLCKDIRKERCVAIKIAKSSEPFSSSAIEESKMLRYIKEKNPHHPFYNCIIRFENMFIENGYHVDHVCLVFEVMGPSLLTLILQRENLGIDIQTVQNIIRQVLQGLLYLHEECGIIHTDLKPENILIKVKDSSISNMVNDVQKFSHFGVPMPKSYVSSASYGRTLAEKNPDMELEMIQSYFRNRSHPNDKISEMVSTAKENLKPLIVDSNIEIKIADLGNGCFNEHPIMYTIQTLQYRALEVLIGSHYSFPADIWSVGCIAFELATGEYLFNPARGGRLSLTEDHLGLIWELLDGIPKYIALRGKKSNQFFNSNGSLKNIRQLKIWKLENVLMEKYDWRPVDALLFADFLNSMIEPDPDLRITASSALNSAWLKEELNKN